MTNDIEQRMARCPFEEARFALLGRPDPQLAFLVRERSATIRYLGETRLMVRGGIFIEGDCLVVAVLLRVGRYVRRIYPTWWNYQDPVQAAAFSVMQRQDLLTAHFYGDNGCRERAFVTENPLQGCFDRAIDRLGTLPPWSSARFTALRQRVLAGAVSLEGLWQQCGGDGEGE